MSDNASGDELSGHDGYHPPIFNQKSSSTQVPPGQTSFSTKNGHQNLLQTTLTDNFLIQHRKEEVSSSPQEEAARLREQNENDLTNMSIEYELNGVQQLCP